MGVSGVLANCLGSSWFSALSCPSNQRHVSGPLGNLVVFLPRVVSLGMSLVMVFFAAIQCCGRVVIAPRRTTQDESSAASSEFALECQICCKPPTPTIDPTIASVDR